MQIIYADNNATTQVAPEVFQAMGPFFSGEYFNPSSMYEPARSVGHVLAESRREIARHLGLSDPKQVLFTSCASESNNTAIFGTAKANPARRHVITTTVEHPAVLEVCKELRRDGYDVTFLGVDRDGNLDVREFIRALRPDTLLVTVMHANNETGVVFPIEQLSRLTKETDPAIVFHTDATQTVGKVPIDLAGEFQHVDLLSFSGHKLHAPKGIGILYIKKGVPCRPLLMGGHQEDGRRAGTENVPYIVGLARAMRLAAENFQDENSGWADCATAWNERSVSGSLRTSQRRPRAAAAQYAERFLLLYRGRGDALPTERSGHLRIERLGLYLRNAGPVARAEGHERP